MTSNINYLSINENFPVAGQDNDTQVFRDNFDTIKTSLRVAKEEITNIQDFGARLDTDNDFGSNTVQKAVLLNSGFFYQDLNTADAATREIDFTKGSYQKLIANQDVTLSFTQFPYDPNATDTVTSAVGKVTVELYSDGGLLKNQSDFVTGKTYTINAIGTTNWTAIGAASATQGVEFVYNGTSATGTGGSAYLARTVSVSTSGGTVIRSNGFPTMNGNDPQFILTANNSIANKTPVIFEVWRNSADVIFMKYLGEFA